MNEEWCGEIRWMKRARREGEQEEDCLLALHVYPPHLQAGGGNQAHPSVQDRAK